MWGQYMGGLWSKAGLVKHARLYLKKITKTKGAGGMAQVIEDLPSTCKALSSNSSTSEGWKLYISFIYSLGCLFSGAGYQTQGCVLARQVVYC
jgi:hypothetical protein